MSTDRSTPNDRQSPLPSSSPRRYDSFVVRLWFDPERAAVLRAEIQHVQSGLVEQAVDVTAAWVEQTILALLELRDDIP
jgi:hypothetical protein